MSHHIKIATIVGARPQFIKAVVLSRAIESFNRKRHGPRLEEFIIHTGQHYDHEMDQVFFEQLKIPEPRYQLGVGSGRHGEQTAKMLTGLEEVIAKERPDLVTVYGDTNSTLAGALAAVKMNIPVAHIEAGLRSFNNRMPEEINRVITDRISSVLFCPTKTSVMNLKKEGISRRVYLVGDVMLDMYIRHRNFATTRSKILKELVLEPHSYYLATVHRQENTENPVRLRRIFCALSDQADEGCPVIVPLHPRTRKALIEGDLGLMPGSSIVFTPPLGYWDMMALVTHAKAILTDSGGVQREAYFARVPCVTLRDETEWTETVKSGWNIVAGTEPASIVGALQKLARKELRDPPAFFGDGHASDRIVKILAEQGTY